MKDQIEEFRAYRAKMNERILAADNKVLKESSQYRYQYLYGRGTLLQGKGDVGTGHFHGFEM